MEEGDKLNQDFKNSIEFLKFLESKLSELGFMLTELKQYYNEYHILFNKLNEGEKKYFKETFPILFLLYSQNKTYYFLLLKILLKEFENLEYSASLSDRDTGDGMNLSIKITNGIFDEYMGFVSEYAEYRRSKNYSLTELANRTISVLERKQ